MALIFTYSKFGTTFNNAYARIENIKYVAKPHSRVTYPNQVLSESLSTEIQRGEPVIVIETKKRCNIVVSIYTSEAARQSNETPLDQKTDYIYELPENASGDLLDLCYDYLKTLPEFSGALDA